MDLYDLVMVISWLFMIFHDEFHDYFMCLFHYPVIIRLSLCDHSVITLLSLGYHPLITRLSSRYHSVINCCMIIPWSFHDLVWLFHDHFMNITSFCMIISWLFHGYVWLFHAQTWRLSFVYRTTSDTLRDSKISTKVFFKRTRGVAMKLKFFQVIEDIMFTQKMLFTQKGA